MCYVILQMLPRCKNKLVQQREWCALTQTLRCSVPRTFVGVEPGLGELEFVLARLGLTLSAHTVVLVRLLYHLQTTTRHAIQHRNQTGHQALFSAEKRAVEFLDNPPLCSTKCNIVILLQLFCTTEWSELKRHDLKKTSSLFCTWDFRVKLWTYLSPLWLNLWVRQTQTAGKLSPSLLVLLDTLTHRPTNSAGKWPGYHRATVRQIGTDKTAARLQTRLQLRPNEICPQSGHQANHHHTEKWNHNQNAVLRNVWGMKMQSIKCPKTANEASVTWDQSCHHAERWETAVSKAEIKVELETPTGRDFCRHGKSSQDHSMKTTLMKQLQQEATQVKTTHPDWACVCGRAW